MPSYPTRLSYTNEARPIPVIPDENHFTARIRGRACSFVWEDGVLQQTTKIMNAPYYLLRGGGLNRNSQYDAGASGSYWSSTPDGFSYAYYLFFYSDYMGTSYVYRYYGYSVRCVAAG